MQSRLGERRRVLPRCRGGVPWCSCSYVCWDRGFYVCFARASWEAADPSACSERGVQQATRGGVEATSIGGDGRLSPGRSGLHQEVGAWVPYQGPHRDLAPCRCPPECPRRIPRCPRWCRKS